MDGCAGAHPSDFLMGVLFVRAACAAGFLMAKRNRFAHLSNCGRRTKMNAHISATAAIPLSAEAEETTLRERPRSNKLTRPRNQGGFLRLLSVFCHCHFPVQAIARIGL